MERAVGKKREVGKCDMKFESAKKRKKKGLSALEDSKLDYMVDEWDDLSDVDGVQPATV